MSDDLIAGAKWTLENAAGMTLENEEVGQLCDMAARIEELEAKLALAVDFIRRLERFAVQSKDAFLIEKAQDALAELTGGPDA